MRGSFECVVSGCLSQPTRAIDVSYYATYDIGRWYTHTYLCCESHQEDVIRLGELNHSYVIGIEVTVSPCWLTEQQTAESETMTRVLEQWVQAGGRVVHNKRERNV